MSDYLARLKEIESRKNSVISSESKLTKPPKGTCVSFVSAIQAVNRKNSFVAINESFQIEFIRSFLFKIGEPEEDHFLVLDKCKRDPDALDYLYRQANGEFDE